MESLSGRAECLVDIFVSLANRKIHNDLFKQTSRQEWLNECEKEYIFVLTWDVIDLQIEFVRDMSLFQQPHKLNMDWLYYMVRISLVHLCHRKDSQTIEHCMIDLTE